MLNSKVLGEKIAAELDRVAAVNALCEKESRDATEAEQGIVNEAIGPDGKGGNVAKLRAQLAQAQAFEAELANQASLRVGNRATAIGVHQGASDADSSSPFARIRVPVSARARKPIEAFKGPLAEQEAFATGRYFQAVVGSREARNWCRDHLGIDIQAGMTEGTDSAGGFLVPPAYEANLIRLVADYGVARRKLRTVPMDRDTHDRPRRTGGLNAYFTGEIGAPTESTVAGDVIKLVAKDLRALTYWSRNLSEDAAIAVADLNMMEMATAFAYKEDLCAFSGDGTSTYGGIVGIKNALAAGSISTATGHTTLATLTLADFDAMIGQLPAYAEKNGGPEWYMHKTVWANAVLRLASSAGGVTSTEIINGVSRNVFRGYPVNFVEVMTSTATSGTAGVCYFGNLPMAGDFGDRRGVTVRTSVEAAFTTSQVAMLAFERFDVNIHDKGDASNAGSIIGLTMG